MFSRRSAQATFTPTDLREANLQQRRNLLAQAAPKDIEELIPILDQRVREAKAAYDKAMEELADALLTREALSAPPVTHG